MANETKNQKAWTKINDELNFLKVLSKKVEFDITASQIKTISNREPRLMAKFDHKVNRPKIFQNNNISLLPITGSSYKLLKFNSYQDIQYTESIESIKADFLQKYQSIDVNEIRSEDKAIIIANLSNIIQIFTEEVDLKLTNKGKFGTGKLNFKIKTLSGQKEININGAGAELDAGFEGDKYYILEAKLGKVDDFNIRQLYYPFKYWMNKIKKEVVPIFFTFSDNMFSFWQFKFLDENDFNSITLVKHHNYYIDIDTKPILSHILDEICKKFLPGEVEKIPFPQADDFEKVINIIELVYAGINTKEDFADYFAFDNRQADYYYNAARYLDLVNKINNKIILTKLGNEAAISTRNRRHTILIKSILSRKVFYDTYIKLIENDELDKNEIIEIMKRNNILKNSTDNMFFRRAQTIISWCKWIYKVLNYNE